MLKTFITMVVVAVIFYSGQIFAQSQGSDSLTVIEYTDSITGVKIEYDDDGSWLRMRATGESDLPFGDSSDIRRAKRKAKLRAKAALAQYMNERITSSDNLDDVANTVMSKQRKGGKFSKDAIRQSVENDGEVISNSAEEVLSGIIVTEDAVKPKAAVTVYAESTPNPSVLKFVCNKVLVPNVYEFTSIEEAKPSPLATALFQFPFVNFGHQC